MSSHARRLRRKSVIRSVLSVHAAYRAFPLRPAHTASLCSAPRTASACSRFRIFASACSSASPACSSAFSPLVCFRTAEYLSAPDHPPASASLPRCGSPARFRRAPASPRVRMLNPAPGAENSAASHGENPAGRAPFSDSFPFHPDTAINSIFFRRASTKKIAPR